MITKDNIKAEVASRLERNISDVSDYAIKDALTTLTIEIPELASECITTTVIGQANYDLRAFPKHFKRLISAQIIGGEREDVLHKINSFDEYRALIAGEQSQDYDEPEGYVIFNDFIYLYPTPDAEYQLKIFSKIFESNVDDIAIPELYEGCLLNLVSFEVLKNKGLGRSEEALGYYQTAFQQVAKFKALEIEKLPPMQMQYNDM
jgi:hypothetical protein